jgi:hypothetical protein
MTLLHNGRSLLFSFVSMCFLILLLHKNTLAYSENLQNQILEVTDNGISSSEIHLMKLGSLIFFRNSTSNELLNLEIDYGQNRAYCSTGKMVLEQNGVVHSSKALQPGNFATICFSDRGKYPVRFIGGNFGGEKALYESTIVVQ